MEKAFTFFGGDIMEHLLTARPLQNWLFNYKQSNNTYNKVILKCQLPRNTNLFELIIVITGIIHLNVN